MDIRNKTILVIGGAGFIGSHVVTELLKEKVKAVIVFDNFTRGKWSNITEQLKDPRCSVFELGGDITQIDILEAAIKQADAVIHLAALWLLHCKDYPRSAFHVNIEGTFNVLELCVKHKVKKLIYSSSASVYGDAIEVPMTEEHPFLNKNFYGATKIAGEAMCTAFYHRYGLDFVGLRYMNVFGPHQDQTAVYTGVIPIMLNQIDAGKAPIINGDGSQAYDFIYVEDIARLNVAALKSNVTNEFFNGCTGVQTTIKELVDLIFALTKSKLKATYKPYSADDARSLVKNRIGDPSKTKKLLKFVPKYSLEQGLKQLISWRKAHGNS